MLPKKHCSLQDSLGIASLVSGLLAVCTVLTAQMHNSVKKNVLSVLNGLNKKIYVYNMTLVRKRNIQLFITLLQL